MSREWDFSKVGYYAYMLTIALPQTNKSCPSYVDFSKKERSTFILQGHITHPLATETQRPSRTSTWFIDHLRRPGFYTKCAASQMRLDWVKRYMGKLHTDTQTHTRQTARSGFASWWNVKLRRMFQNLATGRGGEKVKRAKRTSQATSICFLTWHPCSVLTSHTHWRISKP